MRQPTMQITGGALGTKAVGIGDIDEFLEWMSSDRGIKKLPQDLYAAVAWNYWCVNLRANNIAAIPYSIYTADSTEDIDEFKVDDFPIDLMIPIWGASTWLDLVGAAYWLKLVNRTGVVGLQVLNANTMKIETPKDGAFELGDPFVFVQTVNGKKKVYQPEEIVYFRTFDPKDDVNPGVSSGEVSSLSGSLILNANEWASAFFRNNAMPLLVLEAEGQVPDPEIKRLKNSWNRSLQRALNWSVKILRKGMKVNVIGQPVKDLAMPELSKDQKEQIIAAHNMPIGFAEPKTNRAERQQLEYELYSSHLIPYTRTKITPVIDKLLLNPMGLRIGFHYDQIEAIQREQTSQAEAMSFVVSDVVIPSYQAQLMTRIESRRVINSVLEGANLPSLDDDPVFQIIQAEAREEIIEGEIETPPELPATTETAETGGLEKKASGSFQPEPMPPAVKAELGKWADKCRKRDKAAIFNSDIIPAWFHRQVEAAIRSVGHVEAFSFLKATDTQVRKLEKQMQDVVQEVFDEFDDEFADDIAEGNEPDYGALFAALTSVILPIVTNAATDEAMRTSAEIGIEFDPAFINTEAVEWARDYTFELVTGLTNTTRKLVRDSITTFLQTPGLTQADIVTRLTSPVQIKDLMQQAFSESRAETIATTEVTRANSMAVNMTQQRLNEQGIQMTRIWNTRNDELVCFVCGPLNGTPEIVWGQQFPEGPPAHPNCRGTLSLSALPNEFHLKEAGQLANMRVEMMEQKGDPKLIALAKQQRKEFREQWLRRN